MQTDEPVSLVCPVSGELFRFPILLPCCGKLIDRPSLTGWFATQNAQGVNGQTCPMCRGDLSTFDPMTATLVRDKVNEVEDYERSLQKKEKKEEKSRWSAVINPVAAELGNPLLGQAPNSFLAEVKIALTDAEFIPKPSLFLAVVDRSGSMAGNPWRQVQDGLIHIAALTRSNPFVVTEVVAYQSMAEIVDLGLGLTEMNALRVIQTMQAGGGTNFHAAFAKVEEVLAKYQDPLTFSWKTALEISSVTIAFLTDGQADGDAQSRIALANTFRQMLAEKWNGPLTVHAIGFGGDCDKIFLEEMWKTGHTPGTFRYAEPGESGDMLSRKLTTLFESVSKSSVVPITIRYPPGWTPRGSPGDELEINFPIGSNGKGTLSQWVSISRNYVEGSLEITSGFGEGRVTVPILDGYRLPSYKLIYKSLFGRWLSTLTDDLASELLELSKKNKVQYGTHVFDFHVHLLSQKIAAVLRQASNDGGATLERLQILEREIKALQEGGNINAGRLGDLRFGAQYLSVQQSPQAKPAALPSSSASPRVLEHKSEHDEPVRRYSRNGSLSASLNRNLLQTVIVQLLIDGPTKGWREATENLLGMVKNAIDRDLMHIDNDGNDALMLAAYCGHRRIVDALLERLNQDSPLKEAVLHRNNNDGESAATLAIKARGYNECLSSLMLAGSPVPSGRKKALVRYCIDRGFARTAALLSEETDTITSVNPEMTPEYIMFAFHKGCRSSETLQQMDLTSFLRVALKKSMVDLVKLVLATQRVQLVPDMLADLCLLDDTDEAKPRIAELLLGSLGASIPDFVNTPFQNGDTLLFCAADKGSPKILTLCLANGAQVDQPNKLGNTPLWIACERRYPCIIDALLQSGANPNTQNLKGNSPLVTICQKGPRGNAEKLLAHGADVNLLNANGDSMILICCRNGQPDVLKLLLDQTDPEIVRHVAAIDGFSAVFAATEANKPECLRILHEYGLSLNDKTAVNNPILAGATPLHLAAYYSRVEALTTLLQLGANPNEVDIHGQTALHTAVLKGNHKIIEILRNYCNSNLRDLQGNTAAAYCRNEELRKALINPILAPLLEVARGFIPPAEQKAICDLLAQARLPGCLEPSDVLGVRTNEGRTPLIEAIIYSNLPVIEEFLRLDPNGLTQNDYYGIDAISWAHLTGNARVKSRLLNVQGHVGEVSPAVTRVQNAVKNPRSPIDAQILFLGKAPTNLIYTVQSNLPMRMRDLIEIESRSDQGNRIRPEESENHETSRETALTRTKGGALQVMNAVAWDTKLFVISKIAEGKTHLSPMQIATLFVYDKVTLKSDDILSDYAVTLRSTLEVLPPYVGEVYIGLPSIPDRIRYTVGSELYLPSFISASSSWCVAVDACNINTDMNFTTKRQGVVLLLHSRTGRQISGYTQFAYDMEVIFAPGSRWKVTNWYRGDVICLGQANIRQHTFRIKEEELNRYQTTNAALIIECDQI